MVYRTQPRCSRMNPGAVQQRRKAQWVQHTLKGRRYTRREEGVESDGVGQINLPEIKSKHGAAQKRKVGEKEEEGPDWMQASKGSSTRTPGETEEGACQGSVPYGGQWTGPRAQRPVCNGEIGSRLCCYAGDETGRKNVLYSSKVQGILLWIRGRWATLGGDSHQRINLHQFHLPS